MELRARGVDRRLAAQLRRERFEVWRVLELARGVGGVGVVRPAELVPDAGVAEALAEHALPARVGDEGAEEHAEPCRDERDRQPAERVPDDDRVVHAAERRPHHGRVLLDPRVAVLARKIGRDDAVTARLQLRSQRVPGPSAVPGTVHQSERRHLLILSFASMRIIAGSRKGHTIVAPRGQDTRPTSDRVRENVFNLVGPVDGATVLDLYAGSGGLGLEALSRGAARAVFVENDADAVRAIERNLDKLRLTGARVLRQDAVAALPIEASARRKYDLVLVDPPYDMYPDLQPKLARYLPAVLAADGLLVVETDARIEPELPLRLRTTRKYGQARVTLFEADA